jgi:CubicO group peptidase (beta-lactamase class C family)
MVTSTMTKKILLTIIYVIPLFLVSTCSDKIVDPGDNNDFIQYVKPEQVGWSSSKLEAINELIEQSGYATVMAVYDGKVFFTWGDVTRNYECHSIRKPFLNSLYGIYTANGNINLNATLEDLDIDDIPPSLTHEEKQATVRELLQSRSGVYHEAAAEADIMIQMRPERSSHPHGTFFYYNNWDFNALGTIFEQETGKKIFEEFKEKIADPIGMQDFSLDNCHYQLESNKSMHPAYTFRMSTRDMARFGVLYQQNGNWDGKQLVPADWISESTQVYSIEDSASGLGYGYLWNVVPKSSHVAVQLGFDFYFHTGIGVHALIIIPGLKLVIVERYDTDGNWVEPEDMIGFQIGLEIISARN